MMKRGAALLLGCGFMVPVLALDNGVADTPPMGWCSWERYRCHIICNDSISTECFNERLIKDTADAMVELGYKDAGYNYVAMDDCWQAPQRVNGHLVADPNRFPNGIKYLADYVHAKGLKLGLYTALGNNSCAAGKFAVDQMGLGCDEQSMPRCSRAQLDIDDMVSWDIDHLKVDGCLEFDELHMNGSYAIVGGMLRAASAKRQRADVVYHPSNLGFKFPRQFRELAAIGNQWRFFNDAQPDWTSMQQVIEVMGAGQPTCIPGPLPPNCTTDRMLQGDANIYCASYCVERDQYLGVAGRGGWHDPDEMYVGNTNCSAAARKFHPHSTGMSCGVATHDEERLQMGLWAMASAPLFMSTEVRNMSASSRAILQNKELIAINQDALGRMPFRYFVDAASGLQLWRKELVGGNVAVAVVNMGEVDLAAGSATIQLLDAGFSTDTRVAVKDCYSGAALGWFTSHFKVDDAIPAHGIFVYKLSYSAQYTARTDL